MKLGALIALLERLPPSMPVGLGHAHSWRGNYSQLAFAPNPEATASHALTQARRAVGRTFEGWKGGDYTMDEDTLCWVSPEGFSTNVTVGEHMALLLATWLEEASARAPMKPFDAAPLPWKQDPRNAGLITDADGMRVIETHPALAAEVVRRVNLHDDLVKALDELTDIMKGHLEDGNRLDSLSLQPALRILKAAKGES
jgi:hypothetical protein